MIEIVKDVVKIVKGLLGLKQKKGPRFEPIPAPKRPSKPPIELA